MIWIKQILIKLSWVFQTQSFAGGIDHVRVHPKFLHSNATSHRWALGGMFFVFDCNSLLLNL
jgi:hypothetical protein